MIKLIGVVLIFLFFGYSNQIKKDSQSSRFSENSDKYIAVSCKLFETRYTSEFLSPEGENMLYHSTGHLPHNSEIDVPIVYADYYFLESLFKRKNMEKSE